MTFTCIYNFHLYTFLIGQSLIKFLLFLVIGDPTAPDLTGWRARLAKQGYVASTQRKKIVLVPERLWQYLDENEAEEPDEGFEYRTSRSTCEASEEKQNSVISRMKRMKLQMLNQKLATIDAEIQVNNKRLP